MTRERDAGIGFHHPGRHTRPLTKRKLAFAHLLMAVVLVICIAVAASAVAIGSVRAGTSSALAPGGESSVPLARLTALVPGGLGDVSVSIVRRV